MEDQEVHVVAASRSGGETSLHIEV